MLVAYRMAAIGKRIALVDYDDDEEDNQVDEAVNSHSKQATIDEQRKSARPNMVPRLAQSTQKVTTTDNTEKLREEQKRDDDEDDQGILSIRRDREVHRIREGKNNELQQSKPVKKIISYDKLGVTNPIKSLLQGALGTQEVIEEAASGLEIRKRKIEFDTVSGKRELVIDEPREKLWRAKKEVREPYYYKTMKEIYQDKILAAENPRETVEEIPQIGEDIPHSVINVGGRQETVRDISQGDLIQFDYAKYMEQKEKKDLLLDDKLKFLRGNTADANHAKNMVRAMELLDREATREASGAGREEGQKRNKKQYGF